MKNRNNFFAQPLSGKPIAVYSGWGPNKERNPGDTICRNAMFEIVDEYLPGYRPVDIRPNRNPVVIPWHHNAIVGGGTILPKAFNKFHCSGLLASEQIFLFGSGCLSPEEYYKQTSAPVTSLENANVIPLGVRGPASVRHFKHFYGQDVDWVGDLAFYYAQKNPKPKQALKKISIYYIEEIDEKCRLDANHTDIKKTLAEIVRNPEFKNCEITIYHSSKHKSFLDFDNVTHKSLKDEKEFFASIVDSDFIITERLHPSIIATCYGIPFLYLQTTSKSHDLNEIFETLAPNKELDKLFLNMPDPNINVLERIKQCRAIPNLEETLIDVAQQLKAKLCVAAEKLKSYFQEPLPKCRLGGS